MHDALGEDVFKKYAPATNQFSRSFLLSSFECAALGVAANVDAIMNLPAATRPRLIEERVKSMWNQSEFTDNMGSGVTPSRRISRLYPLGVELFKP